MNHPRIHPIQYFETMPDGGWAFVFTRDPDTGKWLHAIRMESQMDKHTRGIIAARAQADVDLWFQGRWSMPMPYFDEHTADMYGEDQEYVSEMISAWKEWADHA